MTIALHIKLLSITEALSRLTSAYLRGARTYFLTFQLSNRTDVVKHRQPATRKVKGLQKVIYLTITTVDTVTPTNFTKLLQPECLACPRTTTRSPTPRPLTHLASSSSAESDDHVT